MKHLKRINRGHTYADTVETVQRTAAREGILTGGHVILGLREVSRRHGIAAGVLSGAAYHLENASASIDSWHPYGL